MDRKDTLVTMAAFVAASILAACGNAATSGALSAASSQRLVQTRNPDTPKCKSTGGVSAFPCPVTLTASNPTTIVTLSWPHIGITAAKFKDKECKRNHIATVHESGTDTYAVSAGTTAGTCIVRFKVTSKGSVSSPIGTAVVPVTNNL